MCSLSTDLLTCSYRNSVLHNICTEVLEKGFHKSFSELFQLVEQQRLEHARAGPAAILLEPLIENDHTKLEQLKVQVFDTYKLTRTVCFSLYEDKYKTIMHSRI